jgi:rRNA maturation protein Nop10
VLAGSLLVATEHRAQDLQKDHQAIIELAERPVSLVEIGAGLRAPAGVDGARLTVHAPPRTQPGDRVGRYRLRRQGLGVEEESAKGPNSHT